MTLLHLVKIATRAAYNCDTDTFTACRDKLRGLVISDTEQDELDDIMGDLEVILEDRAELTDDLE